LKTLRLASQTALMAVLSLSMFAQTPTPGPNDGVHFVTDTAMYQLSNGQQATVFTARLPVTSRYSAVLSGWMVPAAKGNISLGGLEFREKLAQLFKKATNPDLAKVEVFARTQLGSELNSVDSSKHFAYGFEGGLEFPVGTIAGGTIKTGVRFGFLGVPGAHERFQLGSQATISPQVSLSF
jgi:hypothetical protein